MNSNNIFNNSEKTKTKNEIKNKINNDLIKNIYLYFKKININKINIDNNNITNNKKLLNDLLNLDFSDKDKNNKAIRYSKTDNSQDNYFSKIINKKSDENNSININKSLIIFNRSAPNLYHVHHLLCKNNKNKKHIKEKNDKKINAIKRYINKQNKKPFTTNKENIKIKKNIVHEKYQCPSRNNIIIKKNKSTNNKRPKTKDKNYDKIINKFFKKLANNQRNKEKKMFKLNKIKEEKINSIYTFSPTLLPNKNNKKYLKKLIDKLFINNIIENINNKITNNSQINNNISGFNASYNKGNKLDIVLEENRKNNNFNFMSRLNEYEKRKKNNLEKIRNDIYLNQKKYLLEKNHYNNNNDKYNIEDYHLLNATYSYFWNKRRNIEKITRDIIDEQGITFKPKLNNEYNERIAKNYNILNNESYLNKKNEKILDYLSSKDMECTFHPKINNIYDLNNNNNELDVSERLFRYHSKYKEKLDSMRGKYCNFTFRPTISKNTDKILNKKKVIRNLKEQFKSNIPYSNQFDLLQNEIFDNEEKKFISNYIYQNNNNNLKDINQKKESNYNENNIEIFNTFSNKMNNNRISIEDDKNEDEVNKNNIINNIDNNNVYINDFKLFLQKNGKNKSQSKNKDNDKKKKKTIMNFEYYNNIL